MVAGAPLASVPRSMTDQEVRVVQLEILKAVDAFCAARHLRWFLWAGTLIGAVRHHGFIPWDDDIDLTMPRGDYERFCREFSSSDTSPLRLFTDSTHQTYGYPFARVADTRTLIDERFRISVPMGVNVEIFPLDGWPRGRSRAAVHATRLRLARGLVNIWENPPHPGRVPWKRALMVALRHPVRRVPIRVLTGMVSRIARSYPYEASEEVGVLVWGRAERVERSAYGEGQLLAFEGESYPAPSNPDRVLGWHYGDYMQIPPADQRLPNPHFEAASWVQ